MADELAYPRTRIGDVADDYHGTLVADPYRWLEDADSEDTRAWIDEQNRLAQAWLAGAPGRERVRERLRQLWDRPRLTPPVRRGRRWFQLRNSGLQDQDVLHVMDGPLDEGRVLLDPNTLSAEGTVALAGAAASADARLLAYALSEAGSDWMTWRVRDVETGEDLPDEVCWAKFSPAAWMPDGSGFFYCGYDKPAEGEVYEAANRDHRVCFHRLGTTQDADVAVYERPDEPDLVFGVRVTDDGRYLVLHAHRGTERANRVFYLDLAAGAGGEVVALLPEGDAAYHFAGNDGPVLLFVTDAGAERGRVIAVDSRDPAPERWREVVAEHPVDTLERALLLGQGSPDPGQGSPDPGQGAPDPGPAPPDPGPRLLACYLHHARSRLERFTLDGQPDGEVDLPGIGTVGAITARQDDTAAFFDFVTFTHPPALHRHDLATGETELVRAPGLDGSGDFETEQVFVTSADGTRVPAFLVRRAGVQPTGDVPTLLVGYGGFDIPLQPAYHAWWRAWTELGGMLVVANLRGGGEYGSAWHDAGRLEHKQNVFDDMIAVAEGLVERGWTRPERLALYGASNGGLLVGACLTQRPELFGACVSEVGVLDMLRYHRFTIGWAWASDYGRADDPQQFRWLHAYSPLHNLRPGAGYPATLLLTGDHDDRVVPGHSFKFTAALQAAVTAGGDTRVDPRRPVLARIQTQAGHGRGKPTRFQIEERADVLAFLVRVLAVESPVAAG